MPTPLRRRKSSGKVPMSWPSLVDIVMTSVSSHEYCARGYKVMVNRDVYAKLSSASSPLCGQVENPGDIRLDRRWRLQARVLRSGHDVFD